MKRIFSIIMEYGLGLPTGTIAFWGTLVPRILTVDHTFKFLRPQKMLVASLKSLAHPQFARNVMLKFPKDITTSL